MTTIPDGNSIDPDIVAAVDAEIKKITRIEPRCKICRDDPVRTVVNKLLGMGLTKAAITDVLDHTINVDREPSDRINYDNVRTHQMRHFNPENPVKALAAAIVAKHAVDDDAAQVAGAAVNALSYLEIMMLKGYANLIKEDTEVSFEQGVHAALKHHELVRREAGTQQVAEIIARQNRIIAAIQEFVPPHQIPAMLARVEGQPAPAIDGEVVEDNVDVGAEDVDAEEFDPDIDDDDDDEDD